MRCPSLTEAKRLFHKERDRVPMTEDERLALADFRRAPLSEAEKAFRAALRELARRKEPFAYRAIADLVGWKSVNMAWEICERLEIRRVVTLGKRLALVECPVEVVKAA